MGWGPHKPPISTTSQSGGTVGIREKLVERACLSHEAQNQAHLRQTGEHAVQIQEVQPQADAGLNVARDIAKAKSQVV